MKLDGWPRPHYEVWPTHYIKDWGCYLESKRKPVMLAVQLKTSFNRNLIIAAMHAYISNAK